MNTTSKPNQDATIAERSEAHSSDFLTKQQDATDNEARPIQASSQFKQDATAQWATLTKTSTPTKAFINDKHGLVERFTHKQRQQVASNWLLNRELLPFVNAKTSTVGGKALRDSIQDGTISRDDTRYLVTWLDSPEACYTSLLVLVSFRSPALSTGCLPYAVVKLPTEEQLAKHFEQLASNLS